LIANAPAVETNNNAPSDITYDIVILGAGPAGLSAAIFGARAGLTVLVLGSRSGLLAETPRLENFPGYYDKSEIVTGTGEHWLETTRSQARSLGAHFALPGLMGSSLERSQMDDGFALNTQLDTFHAKSVVVATGATSRKLNLAHEDDLWGKSLHNCAICDGQMYRGKNVLIVGGGDAAVDAAIYLSRQASHVYLVHRRTSFNKVKAQSSLQLIHRTSNIEILTPFIVTEWVVASEDVMQLSGVMIQNIENRKTQFLSCDGAFLMIGATPNTAWLSDTLLLDDHGLIRLDTHEENESTNGMTTLTSLPGVFAAGEVTDSQYRQAITAAAAGAQATLDAERWLRLDNSKETKPSNTINGKNEEWNEAPRKQPHQITRQERVLEKNESQQEDGACDLTHEECIQHIVEKYPVVVFSKPWYVSRSHVNLFSVYF
jgi:thioredoxin reductase (NADPH)